MKQTKKNFAAIAQIIGEKSIKNYILSGAIKLKSILVNFASKCVGAYKNYATILNNISEEMELQNKVASLSNCAVADALIYTIRQIAYACIEPNHETICKYLKQAIEDLASGMDAADMLEKYDRILYEIYYGKGSRL